MYLESKASFSGDNCTFDGNKALSVRLHLCCLLFETALPPSGKRGEMDRAERQSILPTDRS